MTQLSKRDIISEIELMELSCLANGLAAPVTFCYPGYLSSPSIAEVLTERGYHFARRGVEPEFGCSRLGDRGPAYDPAVHHPLLIPTTWSSGPNWISVEDITWAVKQARDGKIAILTFHGVPDIHERVNTPQPLFAEYMQYLYDQNCTIISMRDLSKYVIAAEYVN
jgi:hypothetical protein